MGTIARQAVPPLNALVTGGNRGLGLEVVKLILAHAPGSRVFMGCRNVQAGSSVAAEISRTLAAGSVTPVHLDVKSDESVSAAVARVRAEVPHLDLVCNNAGILHESFSVQSAAETMQTNFDGAIRVTTAFLPMVRDGGSILFTSSGMGARTLGLVSPEHREALLSPTLGTQELCRMLAQMVNELGSNPAHPYHAIPTVDYGISKMGVNLYAQMLARQYNTLFVNAVSPGFTNTGMCANYTGTRVPKEVPLGASVFAQVLFTELGRGRTGTFFKEASKPGTPLEQAKSVIDPWVQ